MEDKLNNIEATLAHQEIQIEELSQTVAKQFDVIDILTKKIDILQHMVEALDAEVEDTGDGMSSIDKAALDKPPHY